MTQLARPDPARNRSGRDHLPLALLRPPLDHYQPIAQGFCGLAGQSLAGR